MPEYTDNEDPTNIIVFVSGLDEKYMTFDAELKSITFQGIEMNEKSVGTHEI